MPKTGFIRPFDTLGLDDVAIVGGKNASLGELYRELTPLGVRVPNGFAVTADAYRALLDSAGAWEPLREALEGLDPGDVEDLARRGRRARSIVYAAPLPDVVRDEIAEAYAALVEEYGPSLSVAVRSSATAEDLPNASFAGQHDTYLNVAGEDDLIEACRRCFASLFTDRAIHYRIDQGFDHFDVALSVGVMKMVRADRGASGVIFTLDTESGFRDVVLVTGAWGLGENVVQGNVNPDEFLVFKPTYEQGHRAVLRRTLGSKAIRMVYAEGGGRNTIRNVPTPQEDQERYCLSDEEVLALAGNAIAIERHYSEHAGSPRPMDIEWARDGLDGELYILQARPETVASQQFENVIDRYELEGTGPLLVKGRAVGVQVASGAARIIADPADLADFRPGEILVSDATSPDWEPVLKEAGAIVTNRGGRTCHAAIVARELGIPAVVGAEGATDRIPGGERVTVSCAEGETGHVYGGEIPYSVEHIELAQLPRPKTRVMLNLGNPDLAFRTSQIPSDGVGLARMEFIINQSIGIHPMALVHPERVTDHADRAEIRRRTRGYDRPADFFVERLSEGVGTIAAAFHPRPVVVRLSDFKSNEYAALIGGRDFEPHEENPMIGFRGASRYAHPDYADGFALECAAMRRVREEMGLRNLRLMIPFCRRIDEAERVLATMAAHGLSRGEGGLEIYVMCEIPNNVILLDEFARHFDGFSIGSNDLTQLTLGVDRDSEIVAFDFDERDPGVKEMIRLAIEGCRRNGRHSGICGQAPSDHPEFCEFLVEAGIDSISLTPDSVLEATRRILDIEKRLGES
ncbi:MAG: phosphoenolpyruvate synthase [Deltaproteobacteria bacterium]|jgi:pyruvate,water dikinase|nr:phosphoenolpyruvate synthase [Deltaproteobacteria bacterium]